MASLYCKLATSNIYCILLFTSRWQVTIYLQIFLYLVARYNKNYRFDYQVFHKKLLVTWRKANLRLDSGWVLESRGGAQAPQIFQNLLCDSSPPKKFQKIIIYLSRYQAPWHPNPQNPIALPGQMGGDGRAMAQLSH